MTKLLKLLKLGIRRFRSPEDYRAMQSYIAEATTAELEAKGVDLVESEVLELGAGRGGYSLVLHQRSKTLIASDIRKDKLFEILALPFRKLDVLQPFPFGANSFDLVFSSSLIEHISKPTAMLKESWRVLRPGGFLFLSLPPFYSLAMVGGHNFKPFHFLGEHLAISIVNLLRGTNFQNYASCYGTWGLYPLGIDQVKELVLDCDFEIMDIYTRMSAINTARLPGILKDLATWHVCYLARKPLC